MVGLQGSIRESLLIYGDASSTVRELQKCLAQICGVATADQRIVIGQELCRPRQLLDECLAQGQKTTVTLIRLPRGSRSCGACGARGLFGAVPRLRRCGGCLDTYFCDRMCQTKEWPRHKRHCFRAGTSDMAPLEVVPPEVTRENKERIEDQSRGLVSRHLLVPSRGLGLRCVVPGDD